jgi:hypothetical protein
MKTSNQFLFAAGVFTLLSLVVYDFLLKAEYRSGSYPDPYKHFVTLNYTNFDVVDLPSSTAANVKFIQGPFSVRVDQYAQHFVQVSQQDARLRIDARFDGGYQSTSSPYILLISCPKLSAVHLNAGYLANDKEVTDTIVREDWNMRQVLIDGFNQDSLHIEQDYGSTVVLSKNHIRAISAEIGESPRSGSHLIIEDSNVFGNVVLDIRNLSKLFLNNATIQELKYQLGDNAQLIVTGKAKNLLNQTNPSQP